MSSVARITYSLILFRRVDYLRGLGNCRHNHYSRSIRRNSLHTPNHRRSRRVVSYGKLDLRRDRFLSDRDTATPSAEIIDPSVIVVLVDANPYLYRFGTLPHDGVGSLHSNQTISRLRETKNLHRFQRPEIQNYKAVRHDWRHGEASKVERENVRRKGNRPH